MLCVLKTWQRTKFNCHSCYVLHSVYRLSATKPAALENDTVRDVTDKRHRQRSLAAIKSPFAQRPPSEQTSAGQAETEAELPPPAAVWREASLNWRSLPKQYLKLSKFRLSTLVVMTSMAGYAMAPAPFDPVTFGLCSLGTGLLSCSANAINQYHEVPFDAQMARTRSRLLVCGSITPIHAIGFATACCTSGTAMLWFGVNGLTAALGLTNLILYTSIYTPLKRISILNTWVGSIVGALPPLMGWAGCTGGLESGAWVLAGMLYAWQFPHFNALSWNLRAEYSRAGYRMMSVTNPGLCRRTAFRYTLAITALSCSAPYLGLTNTWFALEALPLNAYFSYLAWRFYKESDSASSRKLFRFSLLHLPLLMLLMLFNKDSWHNTKNQAEEKPVTESQSHRGLDIVVTPKSIDNVL